MKHARKDYDRFQDPAVADPSLLSPGSTAIAEDEPVFLLRGKDVCAAGAVLAWAGKARRHGAAPEIVAAAERHADAMRAWAIAHGGHVVSVDDHELAALARAAINAEDALARRWAQRRPAACVDLNRAIMNGENPTKHRAACPTCAAIHGDIKERQALTAKRTATMRALRLAVRREAKEIGEAAL